MVEGGRWKVEKTLELTGVRGGIRSMNRPTKVEVSSWAGLWQGKEGQIHTLCRDLEVKELRVFGSAVTGGFDPMTSDVDFLAEFHSADRPGIADRFMGLAEGLERILQRPADVITRPALKNPIFRHVVEETSQPVYAS